MTPLLWAILAYLVIQFAIGIWASRFTKTEDDYLVAGRNLGYTLTTFTIFATWFGAETIVGSAGQVFADGISLTSAEPFGYGLCLILMGAVFARPLWEKKLTTLADLFRTRFSPGVERTAAIILIPGSVLWAAAQIRAFGSVLATSSTMTMELSIAIAAAFVILYTMLGGMLADAVTDFLQGAMLVLGLVIIGIGTVFALGGPTAAISAVLAPDRLRLGGSHGVTFLEALEAWAIPVCGSVVATELVQRVISARSPAVARRSSIGAGSLYIVVGLLPVFVGLAGPALGLAVDDPEQILPVITRQLLPVWVYVLFSGALISAILSTVDSTLLVASGLLSHNVLIPVLGVEHERTRVILARAGVVTFGVVAWGLAQRAEGVFALVEQASAFGSAGSLVAVSFGLFTSWGGARSAYLSLVASVVVYIGATVLQLPHPFLASLAAALAGYVAGAVTESTEQPATRP